MSQLSTTFYSCHQEGYESIRSFTQRLHDAYLTLTTAQQKEGLSKIEESQLSTRLIEGLKCSNTRQWLKQSLVMRPTMTFLELREQAIAMQPESEPRPPQAVAAVSTNPVPQGLDQLVAQMTALATAVQDLTVKNMQLAKQVEEISQRRPEPLPRLPERRDRSYPSSVECYNCGRRGHIARYCSTRVSGNDRSQL